MNIILWILQLLLGVVFFMVGMMKTFQTGKVKASMPWARDSTIGLVKFVGVAELLGGVGLILPWAFDVAPVLTPIAAIGLAIIMVLAAYLHAKRKENSSIGTNVVLFIILVILAIGRL